MGFKLYCNWFYPAVGFYIIIIFLENQNKIEQSKTTEEYVPHSADLLRGYQWRHRGRL